MQQQPVLFVSNLRKKYASKTAVDDISFVVHHGEVVGLIGPNGAGKARYDMLKLSWRTE